MARVLLENVFKRFDDVVAVKDVSLEIKDKEFLVLVGPSGCGKTTTLRMIAGLEEVSDGKIYIGEELVNDTPPKDRNIAMVFQNYALYPHMNVYDNLAFGLKIRGMRKKEIQQRVDEAATVLGISELLYRLPKQLSGGQRQRVAVGRAIVRKPLVFLMDEPLSNLDAKLRVQMRAELKRIHSQLKTTVIYVTHDQVEAMTLGERIAVMLNGEVQQVDKPIKIYGNPGNRFVAGFIGSPPMNFVKGTLNRDEDKIIFENGALRFSVLPDIQEFLGNYVGKEIIFGIRPGDIWDVASSGWIKEEDKHKIKVKVDFRELMGAETYVYVKIDGIPLICRIGAYDVSPGSELTVVLNLAKVHFFDPETQKAVV